VFKPQLRWAATRDVFSKLLAPLAVGGVGVDVQVGADGTHGTLATVTLSGPAASQARTTLEAGVRERLDPFTIRHQISWA
jgi:fatty-acyl-CoA synthase